MRDCDFSKKRDAFAMHMLSFNVLKSIVADCRLSHEKSVTVTHL